MRAPSTRTAPTVGTVRIDGARLTDWDQDELGKHFGYMPQEPSLFEGTIKENIARFSKGRNSDESKEIDEAVSAIDVQGDRYPAHLQSLVNR